MIDDNNKIILYRFIYFHILHDTIYTNIIQSIQNLFIQHQTYQKVLLSHPQSRFQHQLDHIQQEY